MRGVVFRGAGGNEVIDIVEIADPEPGLGEVVVAQRYAGLNTADVLQREGRYPAPAGSPRDIPGLEASGTVVARGPGAERFRLGDRVFGIVGGGGLADRVVVHERHLAHVPEALSEAAAAAVPEAFMTAHDAIRTQAGLRMGEVLLVHGAAGGVGSAAVRIGVAAGARVLAVVRRAEAAAQLARSGVEVVMDDGFAQSVRELTDDAGADVILELVGAPHFPANLTAAALKGRIVTVGVGAGNEAPVDLLTMMQRRLTLIGTVLRARPFEEKALVVRAFEREVLPLLARGEDETAVEAIYPVTEIAAAFDALVGGGRSGKLLVEFT